MRLYFWLLFGWFRIIIKIHQALLSLFILLLVSSSACLSQTLPFQSYTTKDGLPSNNVTALFQDSRGFLWIGTNNGLSVYDGATFSNYSTVDGLSNNFITDIAESRTMPGVIWIATIEGINKFDGAAFTRFSPGASYHSNNMNAIAEDGRGTLWCATEDGLYKMQNGNSTHFANTSSMSVNTRLIVLPDGRVFYCRDDSLYVIAPASLLQKSISLNLNWPEVITCLAAGRDGEVFAGSSRGAIVRVRDDAAMQHKLSYGRIYDLVEDEQGDLWVRVKDGLVKIRKNDLGQQREVHYAFVENLESDYIAPMLLDRENNIWVGTIAQGVMKLADRTLLRFPLPSEAGLLAAADSSGHIWVSARDRLLEFLRDEQGRWQTFAHRVGDQDTTPSHLPMQCDHLGRLWVWRPSRRAFHAYAITSRRGQPSQVSLNKTIVQGRHFHENPLVAFYVDRKNRLWCGMDNVDVEVVDLDLMRTVDVYKKGDAAPGHSIRAIYEDRDGNIWLGDHHDGLSVLFAGGKHPYVFKKFTTADGLPDNGVRSIHQDRDGKIWIGTRNGGLALYENGAFRSVSMKHGLRSNAVWWIGDDDRGRLWLNTDAGIELVDRTTLRPFLAKNLLSTEGVRSFACGLYKDEFFWSIDAAGLNIYEYSGGAANSIPPPVYLKRVQVNGEPIAMSGKLELSSMQNNCTIEYAGVSLRDEKAVRYQYRLRNVDADWGAPTARREVAYAALRPGDYHFEVVAINGDGVRSAEPARLRFIIHPPIWQRWWFVTLVVSSLITLAALAYRYRVNQLLSVERLRTRIATDLHDDIGASLSRIALFSEVAKQEAQHASPRLAALSEKIGDTARELLDAVGTLVWSIDPRHDRFEDVVTHMKNFSQEMFGLKNIDYTFKVSPDVSGLRLPLEARRNILLIHKEAVNNIVKHSSCATARVELAAGDGALEMTIADDGVGLPNEKIGNESHGLSNMRLRAGHIKAELEINSQDGKGTIVHLRLPLPRGK